MTDIPRHADPRNLTYYLIKGNCKAVDNEIIDKVVLESSLGKIELGIIGSSHYFKLNDEFTEILTCSELNNLDETLILNKTTFDNQLKTLNIKHLYNKLLGTQISTTEYKTFAEFQNAELGILAFERPILHHFFSKNSDLTTIRFHDNPTLSSVSTYHTYPEFRVIVSTSTLMTNAR